MTNATETTNTGANGQHRISADLLRRNRGSLDIRERRLFQSLDVSGSGQVSTGTLADALSSAGLRPDDGRLRELTRCLARHGRSMDLSFPEFADLIRPNILLVERALQGNLAIPDFAAFSDELDEIYGRARQNCLGQVASYIPQLARVESDQFGVAVCTVDGQQWSRGETEKFFSVQSCAKPMTYCLALEEHGSCYVHQFVGREPSGGQFNELMLSVEGKPHNPMINAGAIITASLIKPESGPSDRFEHLMDRWTAACGGRSVSFNNAVYQSERLTADRNFALGYYMRENGAFPAGTDLLETLDFYFQSCAIEASASMMSVLAATLANGGVCPVTGERVISTANVQRCLSLMCSCGMYDYSGEFAFEVGLPAKSGVGGGIFIVVPNLLGLCAWSPRLDAHGNSVRGIEFCKQLVKTYSFHNFDSLTQVSSKTDPRVERIGAKANQVGELIWAASKGDLGAIHRLVVRGSDVNAFDYDMRTPLHLAAAEGREEVVRYIIETGANVNPSDRWGGTPLDDAQRHGHIEVQELLVESGGRSGEGAEDSVSSDCADTVVTCEAAGPNVELIYAAAEGNLPAIRCHVARGDDLDSADYDFRTPLHLAAAEGHSHIVQYFINQQLELYPKDRWGNTPLDEARRHGHDQVVALLERESAAHD